MERGERTPNVAMLLKIAELFNVSFDQLMNDDLEID
jgi:transcriptional regulator with XRE-family HTH domain